MKIQQLYYNGHKDPIFKCNTKKSYYEKPLFKRIIIELKMEALIFGPYRQLFYKDFD